MRKVTLKNEVMKNLMETVIGVTCSVYPDLALRAICGDKESLTELNTITQEWILDMFKKIEEKEKVEFHVDE